MLGRDQVGPYPSAEQLRVSGFAAWPVDTVEEAKRECRDAPEWRLDAQATATRFAREVLGYPQPHAGESFGDERNHFRLLIGTDGVPELFLGSVLEVDRYGRCWYVTEGVPREGDLGATLGFVYREDGPHLLLGHSLGLPNGEVGYGDWEEEIDPGLRQWVIPVPDLDDDATGHAIYTAPDESGVSESVGARALGTTNRCYPVCHTIVYERRTMTEQERASDKDPQERDPGPPTQETTPQGDPGPPEMEYFEKGRPVPETDRR